MPLTFKDSDGVDRALLCVRVAENDADRPIARDATEEDIRAAGFVRLATGSDGPTEEELYRIAWGPGPRVLQLTAGRRALFAAGSASRQPEVDRLVAEIEAQLASAREEALREVVERVKVAHRMHPSAMRALNFVGEFLASKLATPQKPSRVEPGGGESSDG